MDLNELTRTVAMAFMAYRRETNLEIKPEWLQLRIHPDDLDDLRVSARTLYLDPDRLFSVDGPLGIPFIADTAAAPGHPILKSTWELTL